jgi:hypothetical protein
MSCDQAGNATSTTLVASAINTFFMNDPNILIVVGLDQSDYFTILACAVASARRIWSKYIASVISVMLSGGFRWLDVEVQPIQRNGSAILLNDSAMKTPQSARFRNSAGMRNDAYFLTHM